jgi:hypothetical protein
VRLDHNVIRQQVANLILLHPELADDEEALALSVESETDAHDYLEMIMEEEREAAAMAGALAGRIAEMEARQARYVRRSQAMRDLAARIMTIAEMPKAVLTTATLYFQKGQQKVVGEPDVTTLPDRFVRITRETNKTAIKEALQAGEAVEGCSLSNGAPNFVARFK